MTWGDLLRGDKKPARVVYLASPRMNERELAAAFRVHEGHPLFRAVLQIIDEELEQVRATATQSVASHGILASWVGGMEILDRLRTRLVTERANVISGEVKKNGF